MRTRGLVYFEAELHCYRCAKKEPTKVAFFKDGTIVHSGATDKNGNAICQHCFVNGQVGDSGY